MKPNEIAVKSGAGRTALLATALGIALAAQQLSAATIDKADNPDDLNLTSSWTGGVVPGAGDIARWSGLAGANSVVLGADLSVNGLTVATTGGAVAIGGGNTLTVGTSGINLSAASQDLTINSNLALAAGNQVWSVASGRTLALGGRDLHSRRARDHQLAIRRHRDLGHDRSGE